MAPGVKTFLVYWTIILCWRVIHVSRRYWIFYLEEKEMTSQNFSRVLYPGSEKPQRFVRWWQVLYLCHNKKRSFSGRVEKCETDFYFILSPRGENMSVCREGSNKTHHRSSSSCPLTNTIPLWGSYDTKDLTLISSTVLWDKYVEHLLGLMMWSLTPWHPTRGWKTFSPIIN